MLVVYPHEHNKYMTYKPEGNYLIFQNYMNEKYKATHKRVTKQELYFSPKIFIYNDNSLSIVTGDQFTKGGKSYIEHCREFDLSIDRKNNIVFLKERTNENN